MPRTLATRRSTAQSFPYTMHYDGSFPRNLTAANATNLQIIGDLTLGMWIYPDAARVNVPYHMWCDSYFFTNTDDTLAVGHYKTAGAKVTGISKVAGFARRPQWQFVTITRTASTRTYLLRNYVVGSNEVITASGTYAAGDVPVAGLYTTFTMGQADYNTSLCMAGNYGPSFVANVVATPAQLDTLFYDAKLTDYASILSGLQGLWLMTEGSGSPQDTSGNGYHLTVSSGITWDATLPPKRTRTGV